MKCKSSRKKLLYSNFSRKWKKEKRVLLKEMVIGVVVMTGDAEEMTGAGVVMMTGDAEGTIGAGVMVMTGAGDGMMMIGVGDVVVISIWKSKMQSKPKQKLQKFLHQRKLHFLSAMDVEEVKEAM